MATTAEQPTGKVVRASNIPVSVGGFPTPEQHKKWLKQQVVYQNYAGFSDELDQIVATTLTNRRAEFYSRMGDVMSRWETIWDAANGNPFWGEWDDDVHVCETRKMLEGKVSRIEEALFEFYPLFGVEGMRGDLPRWKAQIIEAYVFRMMQLANYERYVAPLATDSEICNVAALKLRWDFDYEMVVDRSWKLQQYGDGKPYWRDERSIRDAVTSIGVRYAMVDPFLFWYDLDCGDLDSNDCSFVGDDSDQFIHDLEKMARAGLFDSENVAKVKERKKGGQTSVDKRADWPDQKRASRSVAMSTNFTADVKGQHEAGKIRCSEGWMWFDFGDGWDGVVDPLGRKITGTHKVVITLAQGIPIQFRLNPHDKKFHPYAIGNVLRNGHESVAPSKFEQVVSVNAQYDRYRSNVLRHGDLSVAPFIAARGPFPTESLLGLKPGQVFENITGDLQEIKIGDIPSSVQYMESSFRREHEEAAGLLRVFESPQGTATETERKVQEQQRMVRPSIRANGQLWRTAALKTLWLCAQYSTGQQRFAVVGKASQILGSTMVITPDLMQEDVDIHFHGIQSMHVFGNRASGMAQWANRWGPLMPEMPEIDKYELAREDYELTVGRHNVDRVFRGREPAWNSWPQSQENEMLLSGHTVPIHSSDNHLEHIRDMASLMPAIRNLPQYVQDRIREHLEWHVHAYEAQQAEEAEIARRQEMQQSMTGGAAGKDKPADAGGMLSRGAQTPGITPGSPQARTSARTGREGQGMSQTQIAN